MQCHRFQIVKFLEFGFYNCRISESEFPDCENFRNFRKKFILNLKLDFRVLEFEYVQVLKF